MLDRDEIRDNAFQIFSPLNPEGILPRKVGIQEFTPLDDIAYAYVKQSPYKKGTLHFQMQSGLNFWGDLHDAALWEEDFSTQSQPLTKIGVIRTAIAGDSFGKHQDPGAVVAYIEERGFIQKDGGFGRLAGSYKMLRVPEEIDNLVDLAFIPFKGKPGFRMQKNIDIAKSDIASNLNLHVITPIS